MAKEKKNLYEELLDLDPYKQVEVPLEFLKKLKAAAEYMRSLARKTASEEEALKLEYYADLLETYIKHYNELGKIAKIKI